MATDTASPTECAPLLGITLEQYAGVHASLCAELALAQHAAILARYQLTMETKAAVDHHHRERVGTSIEERASWNRAYQAYGEWLVKTRMRRP